MSELEREIKRIATTYREAFGDIPLRQRVADIVSQATSLNHFDDQHDLKAQAGDLLCSLLQLCHECEWTPEQLIAQTLDKVPSRTQNAIGQKKPEAFPAATEPPLPRSIAIFMGTFDPPTLSHRETVQRLVHAGFDEVVICPTGPRAGVRDHQNTSPLHRAALVTIGFEGLAGATVDYGDISNHVFTPPSGLGLRHQHRGDVAFVVDEDYIREGDRQASIIHNRWTDGARMWNESRFVVLVPDGGTKPDSDLPSNTTIVEVPSAVRSADVRAKIFEGQPIAEFVTPAIESYIKRHDLFVPYSGQRHAYFQVTKPRLLIVADPRNEKSRRIADAYREYQSDEPELILVLGGDGTMLHAIRDHWRKRIPFLGVNTGHLGFLMNERLPVDLAGLEFISYSLPMLRVDTETPDGEQSMGLAFSDVWLERAEGQAAWIKLDVDGETRMPKLVGDGMLVSTAAGSSAYARAMGAIPVPINTPTVTLVGSNIFQPRFWKPMALPDSSLIRFSSLDRSGKRPLRGFLDGTPLGLVQDISVRRSLTASVEMAFTKEFDPAARLLRSLFPPNEA
jgi:NAD+ kinase